MRITPFYDKETERATYPDVRLAAPLGLPELRKIEQILHLYHSKWDTQVRDVNVLFEQPLVLPLREWQKLCNIAEQLAAETIALESIILGERSGALSSLGVPAGAREVLGSDTQSRSVVNVRRTRNMRFDFHPIKSGWCVSEVNSDVPGGWSESTFFPLLYKPYYNDLDCPPLPLQAWGDAVQALAPSGKVILMSAPGYLEDEQVVRTFVTELQRRRIPNRMIKTPAALHWSDHHGCTLSTGERVSVIVRFYQIEWLLALPERTGWRALLQTSALPVINPTISVLSESKRFPLAFYESRNCPTWKSHMPECRDPREVDQADWDHWVLKACYSNTGDRTYLCGSLTKKEKQRVIREAQRNPLMWIAQKRFETRPVRSCRGLLYPCVGVFVVNGRAAGAYVRLSVGQVTDGSAFEAPLLIDSRSLK